MPIFQAIKRSRSAMTLSIKKNTNTWFSVACIHKVTISARQGVSLRVVIFFFTTSMQSLVPLITICTSPRTIHHGREKNNRNLLRGIVERILAVRENLVICAHL